MNIKTRDLVMAGLLLALGILLPSLFHFTGLNGSIFSPMHIPVLLGGFILGPVLGIIIGVLTPILNFLLNGMPGIPILWIMIVELGLYGFVSGVLYEKLNLYVVPGLIISMIIGRLGGAFTAYILSNIFNLKVNAMMFLKGATLTAWPAIIIQIILIPTLVSIYKGNFKR